MAAVEIEVPHHACPDDRLGGGRHRALSGPGFRRGGVVAGLGEGVPRRGRWQGTACRCRCRAPACRAWAPRGPAAARRRCVRASSPAARARSGHRGRGRCRTGRPSRRGRRGHRDRCRPRRDRAGSVAGRQRPRWRRHNCGAGRIRFPASADRRGRALRRSGRRAALMTASFRRWRHRSPRPPARSRWRPTLSGRPLRPRSPGPRTAKGMSRPCSRRPSIAPENSGRCRGRLPTGTVSMSAERTSGARAPVPRTRPRTLARPGWKTSSSDSIPGASRSRCAASATTSSPPRQVAAVNRHDLLQEADLVKGFGGALRRFCQHIR